ncbi:hypothetical protein ACO02O_10072 [Dirofilaria immitis]
MLLINVAFVFQSLQDCCINVHSFNLFLFFELNRSCCFWKQALIINSLSKFRSSMIRAKRCSSLISA